MMPREPVEENKDNSKVKPEKTKAKTNFSDIEDVEKLKEMLGEMQAKARCKPKPRPTWLAGNGPRPIS